MARKVGFADLREIKRSAPVSVKDRRLKDLVGNTTFWSITYRMFKVKNLEDRAEDYGQVAVYKGTLPEYRHLYTLDTEHVFETKRPALIDGNTAAMLGQSWLSKHFHLMGDRSTHFGLFAGNDNKRRRVDAPSAPADSGCCDPSPTPADEAQDCGPAGDCGPGG